MPSPIAPPVVPAKTIRLAEKQLKKAGFNPGAVDGKASPALTAALKEFQAAWRLPITGLADAATLAKLKQTGERINAHKKDGLVSVGQKSGAIKTLEQRLARLGYDVGRADGVYSRDTWAAVRRFKADQSELVKSSGNGALTAKSRAVLRDEVRAVQHAPERVRVKSTKAQQQLDQRTATAAAKGVAEGARGQAVRNLQKHLKAAGFDPQHFNGVFDERTGGAVKNFQRKAGLPVTGVVDRRTWSELRRSYILNAKAPLALHERSGKVKNAEALLKKAGFKPGNTDGFFDRQTLAAVKRFEKKAGRKVDGKLSEGDVKKLKQLASEALSPFRKRILDVARRELGKLESGNNGGEILKYPRYFGRGAEAWCADFVSWVSRHSGGKMNNPWCPGVVQELKAKGNWKGNANPKPGDWVLFDWNGDGTADHIGLVEKVNRNGSVQTIEGNAGHPSTGRQGVWRHTRTRGTILGFGKPY